MTITHTLRNSSVHVLGLVFEIEYYWTPAQSRAGSGMTVITDPPEVEINTIKWTNSAGESQDITELVLGLDRAIQGKVNKFHGNADKLLWQGIMDGAVEAIEQFEQNQ